MDKNIKQNSAVSSGIKYDEHRQQQTHSTKTNNAIAMPNKNIKPVPKKENLKVMFLGGVGEIGKNMTVLQYKNEIIVIDCGLAFPSEDMPGIDIVLPDFSYLEKNKEKVKALIITHAHEDHIGCVPYFLKDINVPVYGSRFTLGMIERKLEEFQKVKLKGICVKARQAVKIGYFNVEFVNVNHSTAGCFALAINTPVGMVVHSGDFKVDYTAVDGKTIDLDKFAELGRKGVLLFMCESTNVNRPGHSMSESKVGGVLDELFTQYKEQRLIIATFASNTYRLKQILEQAEKHKRKVCFTGRSMLNISETAAKVGELVLNKSNIIEVEKIDKYQDNEIIILTTGSQGEDMSGLKRMANDEFNKVKIGSNDVIIFSSSPIPGNEKSVNNIVNSLYKKGAVVINDELESVHASGHACEDEITLLHKLVNPKFFIPVHGEYRHLISHKKLALKLGMDERNILIPDLGYVVEINDKLLKRTGMVEFGERLVDGSGVGDSESMVLRDRKQLSEEGLCVCVIGLDKQKGEITLGPDIIARGLIYSKEIENSIQEAKSAVVKVISEMETKSMELLEIRNQIKRALTHYFYKKTKRRPMVLTIIIES